MKKQNIKIGILGGGQLGRMLQEKALEYGIDLYFLDGDPKAPCSIFGNFRQGSFKSREEVISFGRDKDIMTIEIEHVDAEALEDISKSGVKVIPSVSAIKMIKNKANQKAFYRQNDIPTADFVINDSSKLDLEQFSDWYPFVQKTQTDGYDGKGVVIIHSQEEISKELHHPSIIERLVDIKKELAITVVIEEDKSFKLFPICEMVFDEAYNLVDYVIAPAEITKSIEKKVQEIARKIAHNLNSAGIFSIELFLTKENEILVNEMAPRAHNSVHYTIEATNISQFEAQLRVLLGIPLPEIKLITNAGMLNLIGEDGHHGRPRITNLDKLNKVDQAHIHIYGKKETKPGRKMGHITVLNEDRAELIKELNFLKKHIKVVSDES